MRELHQKLAAEGWIEPWLDKDKILPGQQWQTVIEEAVETADIVIIFLSSHSVQKEGFVQRELRYAYLIAQEKPESTIFLIPVRLEDCLVPRSLRDFQWTDYFGEEKEDSYANLLHALRLRHKQVQPQTSEVSKTSEVWGAVSRNVIPTNPDRLTLAGMEFCRIPAGKFLMGSADSDKTARDNEKPQHTVDIPYDYWLARFPVTNEQYAGYVKAAGKSHPVSNWQQKKDHPVTMVSWHDAMTYCQWLNDLLKGKLPQIYVLRLPTESEWEKAARGSDGRIYPWGNQTPDKTRCNFGNNEGGTTLVGKYSPQGDSPYGCADMSGNVWEWTLSVDRPYPYRAEDGRENLQTSDNRALRGGAWYDYYVFARASDRHSLNQLRWNYFIGFRVVAFALPS